ncbi:hypothetical protein GCM10009557_36170 [Virgisporangium ochraceum]|uniref:Uncharacterized protein n=1 Tax=Virgisporangium ochraceum TaxID=65505 RepID=A0A8J3ZT55_9ACTN|nr:hypothetical protein Voc01_028370 [Virgisporangium ochraceum]
MNPAAIRRGSGGGELQTGDAVAITALQRPKWGAARNSASAERGCETWAGRTDGNPANVCGHSTN